MNLAERMNALAPEGAFATLTKVKELEKQGKDIIHFEIGQPDFKTPQNIVDVAKCALDEGKTRYTEPLGMLEFRKLIAKHVADTRFMAVSERSIAVTPSPKTAIYLAMIATINPGDEVMYPNPGFPTFEILIDFFGGVRKPIPLVEKNNFGFDMSVFRKQFTAKTRLVILNSPSNPTGGIIPQNDLREIATLVLENPNCMVLSDEIYSRVIYNDQRYASIYSFPGMAERTFIVDGFSKAYSMTGWRLGYLVFPERFHEKMDWLATHTYSCVSQFIQYGGMEALQGPQDSVLEMVGEFKKRRDAIVDGLNRIPGVQCLKPEGAFYAFLNVQSFGKRSREITEDLLLTEGVAALDGAVFGNYGEGYLRFCYANSLKNIERGLERTERYFRGLAG